MPHAAKSLISACVKVWLESTLIWLDASDLNYNFLFANHGVHVEDIKDMQLQEFSTEMAHIGSHDPTAFANNARYSHLFVPWCILHSIKHATALAQK